MLPVRIVVDTNVFLSALRLKRGASFRLLSLFGDRRVTVCVSVPLILEYEEIAKRNAPALGLSLADIDDILDYTCSIADRRQIYYLWRPYLRDPADDLLLELAVEADCDFIITFNTRHFTGVDRFGVAALTPTGLLERIGEVP